MIMRFFYLFLLFLVGFSSPKALLAQLCESPGIMTYRVKARQTDRAISFSSFYHYVYLDTVCPPKGTLLLYFVGSYDNPAKTTYFPKLAAGAGYHVIVLEYPNRVAAKSACAKSARTRCYHDFRLEILEGKDYSQEVDIKPADGIENRLSKLLLHLQKTFPNQGWEQFLTNQQSDWTKMVLAGHSQGGGHAIFISTLKPVLRAIGFAAPNDYSEYFNQPAPWTGMPSVTPPTAQYVFLNLQDDVVPFEQQYASCKNLGLTTAGDSISVDRDTVNFTSSHILYTQRTKAGLGGNHSLMIRDANTPLDADDLPIFLPEWKYLLGIKDSLVNGSYRPIQSLIQLHPNPGSFYFKVMGPAPLTRSAHIDVWDLRGHLMYSGDAPTSGVKTGIWPSGVYIVSIRQGGRTSFVKWIKSSH